MNKCRGFVQLSMMAWGAIATGAVILALGFALKVQTVRLDTAKTAHATYVAQVEALGRAAAERATLQAKRDLRTKENADEENVRTAARDAADARRVRDDIASRGVLPPSPAGAKCPDGQACFDRAKLDAALREFAEGAAGIAVEGTGAVTDLDTAKKWAKEHVPSK